MQNQTCFVVVDARPIHREGLMSVLRGAGVAQCSAAATLDDVPSVGTDSCTVVVLIEAQDHTERLAPAVEKLRSQLPDCRIVLLAAECSRSILLQAVEANLDGLLEETIECEALIKALELVALGETIFLSHADLLHDDARANLPEHDKALPDEVLTSRELDVLRALTAGQPNKVIARACGITESTVKVHVKAIMRKIHVKNRTQAAIWAQRLPHDAARDLRTTPGYFA